MAKFNWRRVRQGKHRFRLVSVEQIDDKTFHRLRCRKCDEYLFVEKGWVWNEENQQYAQDIFTSESCPGKA